MTGRENNRPNGLIEHAPVTLRRFRAEDVDALFGSIGLMTRCGPGGLEIGYWVHRAYTGRGLATAATAALVQEAFGLPGVDWVEIVHDELNVASGQIPRKLGFTEAGRRPLDSPPPSGTGTGVVWRLTR
jgi:ribosomal-protein-serine acetyltransferase